MKKNNEVNDELMEFVAGGVPKSIFRDGTQDERSRRLASDYISGAKSKNLSLADMIETINGHRSLVESDLRGWKIEMTVDEFIELIKQMY